MSFRSFFFFFFFFFYFFFRTQTEIFKKETEAAALELRRRLEIGVKFTPNHDLAVLSKSIQSYWMRTDLSDNMAVQPDLIASLPGEIRRGDKATPTLHSLKKDPVLVRNISL